MNLKRVKLRLLMDYRYRMVLTAAASLVINLAYALYHGVLGILTCSLWFVSMCAYYLILSVMRISAVLCERKNGAKACVDTEYLVMKLSGALLMVLGLVLGGVNYLSLSQSVAAKHAEIIMITIAAYTFYKLTMVIVRAVKAKKHPAPLLSVLRNISCAEIAASILTMQRSMLVSFGSMDAASARTLNILTGAAVFLFVFWRGTALLARGMRRKEVKPAWQN